MCSFSGTQSVSLCDQVLSLLHQKIQESSPRLILRSQKSLTKGEKKKDSMRKSIVHLSRDWLGIGSPYIQVMSQFLRKDDPIVSHLRKPMGLRSLPIALVLGAFLLISTVQCQCFQSQFSTNVTLTGVDCPTGIRILVFNGLLILDSVTSNGTFLEVYGSRGVIIRNSTLLSSFPDLLGEITSDVSIVLDNSSVAMNGSLYIGSSGDINATSTVFRARRSIRVGNAGFLLLDTVKMTTEGGMVELGSLNRTDRKSVV